MNERIIKLRTQSLNAIPRISIERAKLLTEFYTSHTAKTVSIPIARAMALKYILENETICINDGELIVGERGPEPAATPTYPEVCIHSQRDFEILHTREKIPFNVSPEVLKTQLKKIIPFWKGKSIREKIFQNMETEWLEAYEAGVFTEFMEQRAPGHTVGGKHIWKKGFLDYKKEILRAFDNIDLKNDPNASNKQEELKAMNIAADAIISFAHRYSKAAAELANIESDSKRKEELWKIAEICSRVPAHAPRTFWEALQHYWFIHLGVITEYNTWDSFNPGRLDQHLISFYRKGLENGNLTPERAEELLQAFWIKFNNQPAPPKVGITAEESNTYTDFCNINIGGLTEEGEDGVNELSYILLDVVENMRILQPSSNVQLSHKTPDEFLLRALKIIKTGFGQPSIFNTDATIQELVRQGKDIKDARNGGNSGCVESGAFGREAYILTGYFNLVKILEITLHNGEDPLTGKQIGLKTGKVSRFSSYENFFTAFSNQVRYFLDIKYRGSLVIEKLWAENLPAPFLSIITLDCIKNRKDYNDGGAQYNTSYIQIVGMGSITDCLSSIKYNVFDKQNLPFSEMVKILDANFENYETWKAKFLNKTPKYGNDDHYADQFIKPVFDLVFNAVDGLLNTRGGCFHINLLPTTVHIYFGKVTGATPDGREAYTPLSEGISPVQGADTKGPTAVLNSAAKIPHLKTGGTLLNQKFTPDFLKHNEGIKKIADLIRTYFRMDGHHIQFNVVSRATLLSAQQNPIEYQNLIVRVAGYSDYFLNLGYDLQNEIIKRTEHSGV
ncbi:MAG: glycyl radical protein [Candidatus Lokiarchaeota archaeon]|nr:glycyl radical protein [Candidatus Lokiarchaeota archaeon]